MKRHKDILSERVSKNITYARASTDAEVIDTFFGHLEKELAGIPGENIWNYDETNVQDDPGSQKVITRRGAKYPEKIQNASRACTSIMACGSAAGELAPLYVNYKAEKLWSTWTENGPKGARYNRTKSGWFDHQVFEDWFMSLMLPILKKQDGPKALIGDNLSSHISLEVLRLCEENNVKFIAFPPNAIHLLQPLDVAVFRSLKIIWRSLLAEWKESTSGSRCTSVPKDELPGLLKKMAIKLQENIKTNLKSGFRKTGIFPLDKTEGLQRLPKSVLEESLKSMTDVVGDVFLEELNKKRKEVTGKRATKRRKMLNVPAGKSISVAEVEEAIRTGKPTTGKKGSSSSGIRARRPRKRSSLEDDSAEESSDSESSSDGQHGDNKRWSEEDTSDYEVPSGSNLSETDSPTTSMIPNTRNVPRVRGTGSGEITFKVDDFVVVNFEGQLFPGRVTEVKPKGYIVSTMERSKKNWRWPDHEDAILYSKEEVLYTIESPKPVGKRGIFEVKDLD
ncbi:hypothetical protein V5799_027655 [Amblyomma americanum]|uniref:DDE-1 domain-containing protein n=1 Tax=Amblyomma americanum TaxID=6943 RepID=A0AAQ4DF38_AMBAM